MDKFLAAVRVEKAHQRTEFVGATVLPLEHVDLKPDDVELFDVLDGWNIGLKRVGNKTRGPERYHIWMWPA